MEPQELEADASLDSASPEPARKSTKTTKTVTTVTTTTLFSSVRPFQHTGTLFSSVRPFQHTGTLFSSVRPFRTSWFTYIAYSHLVEGWCVCKVRCDSTPAHRHIGVFSVFSSLESKKHIGVFSSFSSLESKKQRPIVRSISHSMWFLYTRP